MKKKISILLSIIVISVNSIMGANRYWIAGAASNWNNTANWSATNGGAGGASIPVATDDVFYNNNGLGNCLIDAAVGINAIDINSAYTGVIDLNGNAFNIAGAVNNEFAGGTINDTPGTSSLTINSTARTRFLGTTFGVIVNATSARLYLNGSIFNASTSFTKTGVGNDVSTGGNTFNSTIAINNSSVDYFLLANTNPDIFNGDLTVTNTGTDIIYLAHNSAGNQFNGNIILNATAGNGIRFGQGGGTPNSTLATTKTITVGGSGFSVGSLRIRNFNQVGGTAQNITLTGSALFYLEQNTIWNGNAIFTAPRIFVRQNTFNGTASITKSGASGDGSYGGNLFNSTATIINNGSDHIYFAQTNADTFNGDVTLIVGGTGRLYMSNTAIGNLYNGNIFLNYITNQNIYIGNSSGTSSLANTKTISIIGAGASGCGNLVLEEFTQVGVTAQAIAMNGTGILTIGPNSTFNADIFTSTPGLILNQSAFNGISSFDKTGVSGNTSYGGNTYNAVTTITNSGSNYLRLAGTLGNTYNSTATFSSTGSSLIEPSRVGNSIYNDDLFFNSTNTSTGIRFGNGGGSAVLAATKTVNVGGSGFSTGELRFRNFTQTGNTAQALTLTGTGYLYNYNSDWGGDVIFIAPRNYTRGTLYNRTAYIEKTGATNDASAGGNTFTMDADFVNSGSGYLMMGNGTFDTYSANVTLTNTGTYHMYFAYNGAGHTVAGDLTTTNSGTGTSGVYIGSGSASTLLISGNVSLTQNGTGTTLYTYFGDQGDITTNGTVIMTNSGTGTTSDMRIANNTNSSVTIAGNTTITNNNTATTTNRMYIGNQGDITFNGTLELINNASAANSQIYCNNGGNSVNLYNENITVSSTSATCDGVRFGEGGGSGTLAATKTVTIGAGGFISGDLEFRNFTQTGNTTHSLTCTGTARIYNYDSDWGGDVTFIAPRNLTRGTLYNRTAYIEKTGAFDDQSLGGNTFTMNADFVNSGSGYLMMGNGTFDTYSANVTLSNTGTDHMYFAYNGAGHNVAGDLIGTNSPTGTTANILIGSGATSTLNIGGNVILTQNGSATTSYTYLGDQGDVTLDGTLTMINSGTGTTSSMYLANNTNSSVTIAGATSITNNNTAATTNRMYIGNQGDITFNGTLELINNAGATNSEIYCNYSPNSVNLYSENITVQATNATSDGVRFGQNGGNGTLAATKTVTIGAGGFISGDLEFRNFTQTGNTTHSLTCTGTARLYNYDSDWGGDVTFIAPRNLTRGTLYNRTAYIEKTGATNDASAGGNTFSMNVDFVNSGNGYLMMGNGTFDTHSANVTLTNTGSNRIYFAHNGAGHAITGDFTSTNSSTGTNSGTYISNGATATLSIGGNVSLLQNGNATAQYTYFGDQGDITTNGTVTMTNSGTGTTSDMRIANNTNSSVTIAGNTTITNNNTATTTSRMYIGNQGDITFNGTLDMVNNSGVTNSELYCNYGANSVNLYNENITVQATNATSDGIRFGQGNGNGTLATAKTVTIGAGGFISGDLEFRNFTQLSATAQNLAPTGTTRIYNYDSQWNGNVDFRSPRMITRGTTYNSTAFLEKNGVNNDASTGGNVFNSDATFQNTSTAYFMPANGTSNDFNASATYIKTNSGRVYPSYNCISTYAGDITVNSGTTVRFGAAGNGRILFDGTAAQSVNVVGATPTPEFRDFHTNNTNSDITLNTPVIVLVELDLDNGHVITNATDLLIMNNNAIVSSAGESAFVNGPIRKIGNDAFEFPVGKNDTAYAPISISAPTNAGHHFTAEYFQVNPDNVLPLPYTRTLKDPSLDHISGCEYWILDRTNGASNVNVTLSWEDRSCGVTNLPNLAVARWDGAMWKDHGNGGTTGNNIAGTVISSSAVTSFSPFTLASTTGAENPLPVELISFNATLNNEKVDLSWQTASEINNDYFTLEKSLDGFNWESFSKQDGAWNSSSLISYNDVDYNPYRGTSYYRLKQTDFNGEFEYSEMVVVDNHLEDVISIYPNPIKDVLFLTNLKITYQVKIYSINGQIIYSGNTNHINSSKWSNGIYQLIITDDLGKIIEQRRIVK